MSAEAYQFSDEDDIARRVRDVYLDGVQCVRISLPDDDEKLARSLPYAERICDNLSNFLKTWEIYRQEQQTVQLELYERKKSKIYRECANEIGQLVIDMVAFNSPKRPDHAEVSFRDLSMTERAWFCGYAGGEFYGLGY